MVGEGRLTFHSTRPEPRCMATRDFTLAAYTKGRLFREGLQPRNDMPPTMGLPRDTLQAGLEVMAAAKYRTTPEVSPSTMVSP